MLTKYEVEEETDIKKVKIKYNPITLTVDDLNYATVHAFDLNINDYWIRPTGYMTPTTHLGEWR